MRREPDVSSHSLLTLCPGPGPTGHSLQTHDVNIPLSHPLVGLNQIKFSLSSSMNSRGLHSPRDGQSMLHSLAEKGGRNLQAAAAVADISGHCHRASAIFCPSSGPHLSDLVLGKITFYSLHPSSFKRTSPTVAALSPWHFESHAATFLWGQVRVG